MQVQAAWVYNHVDEHMDLVALQTQAEGVCMFPT